MCVCVCVVCCVCVRVCACMMHGTDQCRTRLNVCVGCVWGGRGVVFPYLSLCGLFWWDCALRVYRISYLG